MQLRHKLVHYVSTKLISDIQYMTIYIYIYATMDPAGILDSKFSSIKIILHAQRFCSQPGQQPFIVGWVVAQDCEEREPTSSELNN